MTNKEKYDELFKIHRAESKAFIKELLLIEKRNFKESKPWLEHIYSNLAGFGLAKTKDGRYVLNIKAIHKNIANNELMRYAKDNPDSEIRWNDTWFDYAAEMGYE